MIAMRIGLTPTERMKLFAVGALKFQPKTVDKPTPWPPGTPAAVRSRKSITYGDVRALAKRYRRGDFVGHKLAEVAAQFGVGYESLKAAEWKLRKEQGT